MRSTRRAPPLRRGSAWTPATPTRPARTSRGSWTVSAPRGRIDLVHCNNSKDEFGSGRDRHDNLEHGMIDPKLIAEVVRAAAAPVVCETPDDDDGQAAAIRWLM